MMWHVFVPLKSLFRQLMGEGIHYVGGHCEWLRWKSGFEAFRGGVDGVQWGGGGQWERSLIFVVAAHD